LLGTIKVSALVSKFPGAISSGTKYDAYRLWFLRVTSRFYL